MEQKRSVIIFLSILLLIILSINFINSATVVVQEKPKEEKKGFFDGITAVIFSPVFLGIAFAFILIVLIAVGIFFLVRWLIKFLKQRSDIFYKLKQERVKLAKTQSSYKNIKHWFKVSKNIPIRLVKRESGRLRISNPIAYLRGNYTTHEGNIMIAMNMIGRKKFIVFPSTDVLIIPDREFVKIDQTDEKGKRINIIIKDLPRADDIIQYNDEEVLLFAESISNVGNDFYVPVLKSKDGRIIDLSLPIYQTLREVVLGDFLYQQSQDFVDLSKKAVNINPFVSATVKLQDSNTSTEVPQK